MGKLCSATSLVALAVLSCLAGTEVETPTWRNRRQAMPRSAYPHSDAKLFSPRNLQPAPRTVPGQLYDLNTDDVFYPQYPPLVEVPPLYYNWHQQGQGQGQQGFQPIKRPPYGPSPPQQPNVEPPQWPPPGPSPPQQPNVEPPQWPPPGPSPPQQPNVEPPQWPPPGPSPPQQPNVEPPQWPPYEPSPPQWPPYDPSPPQPPAGPPQQPPYNPPPAQPPAVPPHQPPYNPPPPQPPIVPPQQPPYNPPPPQPPIVPPQQPPYNPPPPQPPIVPPQQPPYNPPPPQPPIVPPQQPPYNPPPPQPPIAPAPQPPPQPSNPYPGIPPPQQPNVQTCNVPQRLKVPCGVPGITADACSAISCCFDGQQCYYGKAVTVQCTKDGQFIVVVARDATLPNINLETISMLGEGPSCTYVDSNLGFAIYQFPVTACGTTVTEEPGIINYVNRMSSYIDVGDGPYGSITRDTTYELIFQCRYIGSAVETLIAEVKPSSDPSIPVAALGPITVQLRVANGHCTIKGCNEVDVAYNSFYVDTDYPITKVLRDPVYVEVQLTQKTDPNLILTLGRCWTTTTPLPHSYPQWDILINGCPYQNDKYMSTLVPVGPSSGVNFPTHYRRFIFKMFTFVDQSKAPMQQNVYIHCSTAVCTAAPGSSCEPMCARKKRHLRDDKKKKHEPHVVVSAGPMIIAAA